MRVVGIDWGSKSIDIALLTGGRKIKIARFASEELPETETEEKYLEASETVIAEIFRKGRFPRDRVVVGLPMQEAMLRELTVPFTSKEQIRKVIKFEVENYLPAFSIEDLVVDAYRLETVGDKTRLMAIAMEKRKLAQRLAVLHRLDIDPIAVDLDVMCIYNAVAASELVKELNSFLVIDFGAGSTKLILVEDGRLAMVRALRMGSDSLNSSIQKDLEIDYQEAKTKRLRVDLGGPETSASGLAVSLSELDAGKGSGERIITTAELEEELILQREEDFLERICKEISRTLSSLKLKRPIELACIIGGGSTFKDAELFFTNRLGIETVRLDLLSYFRTSLPAADREKYYPVVPVAIGAALKEFGRDSGALNFRKEEYRFANPFELLKTPLTVLVATLLVLFLLFSWGVSRARATLWRQYQGQLPAAKTRYQEAFKDDEVPKAAPGEEVRAIYQACQARLNKLQGPWASLPTIPSALLAWHHLGKAIGPARDLGFKLQALTINAKDITLEVILKNEVAMETLRNRLLSYAGGETRPFKQVKSTAQETAEQEKRFSVTISLEEEAGP